MILPFIGALAILSASCGVPAGQPGSVDKPVEVITALGEYRYAFKCVPVVEISVEMMQIPRRLMYCLYRAQFPADGLRDDS